MRRRILLGPPQRSAVARGRFVSVDVEARSVLVGRAEGAWRAYENLCRHRALRLDFEQLQPMSDDGRFLLCHHHGALYRPSDGVCVVGPCAGERLVAIDVVEDADGLWITDEQRNEPLVE